MLYYIDNMLFLKCTIAWTHVHKTDGDAWEDSTDNIRKALL